MPNGPTLTANRRLPFSVDAYDSIPEALDYAARGDTGLNFYSARGEFVEALSYAELRERAIDVARKLVQARLPRGARMAIMADTSPSFVEFFFGCQYAGLIPVPLPLPMNLGGREEYIHRLGSLIEKAGVVAAVAPEDLLPQLREAVAELPVGMVGAHKDFIALPSDQGDLRPFGKDDPCYIQYSSGSTRLPRGVTVTQRSLLSNGRGVIRDGLKVVDGDRCVSWLPLYHDMGLVGFCLSPLMAQLSVDYLATADFARRPLTWLSILSQNQGTLSYSPTFGYHLCARRATRSVPPDLELAAWRVAGVGGEMIQPKVLEQFAETFAGCNFRPDAFLPSYGLAEFTLAASFAPLGSGIQIDHVDKQTCATSYRAVAVEVDETTPPESVSSFAVIGPGLPGHVIEIRDPSGKALPDRMIGTIHLKGPSVMAGYFRDRDSTREVLLDDGWLDTGDMGYMIDGSLVITGRIKDLIIYHGRNIWPQDIEWAVERLSQVQRGDVAAFSVFEGDEDMKVVVVVECRLFDAEARQSLTRDVAATVYRHAGVDCEVVLVPPRSLPHTSSGKLSRASVKAKYLSGLFSWPGEQDDADLLDDQSPEPISARRGRHALLHEAERGVPSG